MAPEKTIKSHRSEWKKLTATGLYRTGILNLIQRLSRSYELRAAPGQLIPHLHKSSGAKFAILCYHRIGTGGVPLYSELPPEIFEAQVRFLKERYRVVSLDEMYREMQNPVSREQMVAITFDDGYRDLYNYAFPILQRYGIPATIYLIINSMETGEAPWYDKIFVALDSLTKNRLEVVLERPRVFELYSREARITAGSEIVGYLRTLPDQLRREWCLAFNEQIPVSAEKLTNCMLTWEQVRAMFQAGVSFGSHTMSHPVFSRLPPAEMEAELQVSKRILEERINAPVHDFAYPFGKPEECGLEAGELLARCGYRSAVTTTEGVNSPNANPYRLRRTQIGEERSLAMFMLKLNQLFFMADDPSTRRHNEGASLQKNIAAGYSANAFKGQD